MFPRVPLPERIGPYLVLRRLPSTGGADRYLGREEGPRGFTRMVELKLAPAEDDPDEPFVTLPRNGTPYRGALEPPVELVEVDAECAEPDWKLLGAQMPEWERD